MYIIAQKQNISYGKNDEFILFFQHFSIKSLSFQA